MTPWGIPAVTATNRVTPPSGGPTTPPSRVCGPRSLALSTPHALCPPFSSPTAFQPLLGGVRLTPRGESWAELLQRPQDPLPSAPPPHLELGVLAACLTPMESHLLVPGLPAHRGSTPAPTSPLFICSALGKAAWPCPQRGPGRDLRTPFQVCYLAESPAPTRALGYTYCHVSHMVALLRGWGPGVGPHLLYVL